MIKGPQYPNQQLEYVSLEVFFPGQLSALNAFGEVQDTFASELPHLFVPNVESGDPVALRPYQLRDKERKRALAFAVNQAIYMAYEYPGYEVFGAEAVSKIQPVLDLANPPHLNRVIYRYENEVGIGRDEKGLLPVEQLFPEVLPTAMGRPAMLNAHYEGLIESEASRRLFRGWHARIEGREGTEVLKVSVYAGVEEHSEISALKSLTDEAHAHALELFETLISDDFRTFISSKE